MKNQKLLLPIVSFVILLQGCSHTSAEKKVDHAVAQEEDVNNASDLRDETTQLIQTTPGLTEEQRSKLSNLQGSTQTKLRDIRVQSVKLRAVLIKELITSEYKEKEVNVIKNRIKDLENKRVNVIFDAVEKANKILGRDAPRSRQLVGAFFEGEGHVKAD